MNDLSSVAIVLLNYNGKKYLERNIPFILQTSYENKEIIVIDNASTDDSLSFLKEKYPSIRTIVFSENLGYAGGYNEGLKKINADYYILLNTDVEVAGGFVEPLIKIMNSDASIAICQPKILSLEHRYQFEYAGAAGGFIDKYGYTFARGRILDRYEKDKGQYDQDCPIFWAGGACFAIKASVFHELNGFYEYFFMYFEEVDLCWRAHLAGYKIWHSYRSVIYHRETNEFIKQSPKRIYYVFRNNFICLLRNLPVKSKITIIPARIALNLLAAFVFLLKGHGKKSLYVIKSLFTTLTWALSAPKQKVGRKKPLRKLQTVYKKSILMSYYFRKKKYFSELKPQNFK
jgi:GT2 family glycosyltransferase